jgi:carboxypeptidase family protein
VRDLRGRSYNRRELVRLLFFGRVVSLAPGLSMSKLLPDSVSQAGSQAGRRSRAGAAPRGLLFLLAAVAVVLGALVVFLVFRSSSDTAPAGPQGGHAAGADAELAFATADTGGDRKATASRLDLALPDGIPIPVGVRLAGPGKLRGRALAREDGQALAGVRVDLLPLPPAGVPVFGRILRLASLGAEMAKRVEPIAVAGTDAFGEFVFEGVRPGTYYLEARGTRHVPDSVVRVRVAASGDGGPVDIYLRSGGRVVGQVLLPEGGPAAGAKVALSFGATTVIEAARSGDVCYLEALANEDGRFVLSGVPASDGYQVTASGSGFAISHLLGVVVRAGEDTQVVVHARAGASIEGRILSVESRNPAETKEDGKTPLEGAHVGAVPRGLRDLTFVEDILEQTHAITDASGRYVMHHVPTGEVDVLAIAPGHVPAKGPRVIAADGTTSNAPDFELPRGPMVSGRVVDTSGAPIPGVTVRWDAVDLRNFDFDFSFAPLLAQAVKGFDFPVTDSDGRFTAGAFPGEKPYRIDFFKVGYRDERHRWDPEKEPGELAIVLSGGGAIEGVVMDSVRHVPVTSFTITGNDRIDRDPGAPGRMNPFSGGQLVEEPQGRFHVDAVKIGKSSLTFTARGFLPTTVDELEVVEGQVTRGVIVELAPGGTLAGTVRDSKGEPIAGAQVFALEENGRKGTRRRGGRGPFGNGDGAADDVPPGLIGYAAALGMLGDRAVVSKPDGSFELVGLEPGQVTVMAAHRDYTTGKAEPVELASGKPAPAVELVLLRGGGVYGNARDRFGRPVSGAIVIAMSPSNMGGQNSTGAGLYQGSTDATGAYKIEHMSSGGYFLMLTRGDEALNPMSFLGTLNFDLVTVPPEEMLQFDIVDTSSGACHVFGTVSAAGKAIGRGSVVALGFESESMLGVDFKLAPIKDDGSYDFAGLSPGDYQFQINANNRGGGSGVKLTIDVPDLPEARIDLAFPEGGVEGRVVDDATGAPLEGADVRLADLGGATPSGLLGQLMSRENTSVHARTDAQGAFRFERLQAGEYELTVRPPRTGADGVHYAPPGSRKVEVRENAVVRGIELRLLPALAITGLARRTGGEPLEGVEIVATPIGPGAGTRVDLAERATSDAQGRFRIDDLAEGAYELTATKEDFAPSRIAKVQAQREGSAAAGAPGTGVEIVLREGIAVSVRVIGPTGAPAAGATAHLVAKDPSQASPVGDAQKILSNLFEGKGVSDAHGLLELGRFAPGEYTLEVRRGLSQAPPQQVRLEEGPPVELRAHLR